MPSILAQEPDRAALKWAEAQLTYQEKRLTRAERQLQQAATHEARRRQLSAVAERREQVEVWREEVAHRRMAALYHRLRSH